MADTKFLKDILALEDDDGEPTFLGKVFCWFHTPGSYGSDYEKSKFKHSDDIWHHEEVFDGDKYLIESTTEWYESPNVDEIYRNHKYLFNQNLSMNKPFETYYEQNVDSNKFVAEMEVYEELPSENGELWIEPRIETKSAPSGENNFAFMDYSVKLFIQYDSIPDGIDWLPRIIAYPLNKLFRYYFVKYIGEEMLEYDIEYSRERFKEYFEYLRDYHGEEPMQTRSRRAHFKAPYEGTFFK